jgi:hypothetical protein
MQALWEDLFLMNEGNMFNGANNIERPNFMLQPEALSHRLDQWSKDRLRRFLVVTCQSNEEEDRPLQDGADLDSLPRQREK